MLYAKGINGTVWWEKVVNSFGVLFGPFFCSAKTRQKSRNYFFVLKSVKIKLLNYGGN